MAMQPSITPTAPPEAGRVTRLANRDSSGVEYQELKFAIHRKLLERINLEALSFLAGERARSEIRVAVARLVEEERTPLSLAEKEKVIEEVLDEVFGLGPLEPLLRDPTIRTSWLLRRVLFTLSAGASSIERRSSLKTTIICSESSKRLWPAWAAGLTNRRRWLTPGYLTAPA